MCAGVCGGVGIGVPSTSRPADQQTSRPADQQGSVRMRVGFGLLLRFYFLDVYGFARVPDLDCAARVARIGAVG